MGAQAQALQQGAVSAGQVSGRCGCGGRGGTEPNMCGGQRVLCRFSCQFIVSDDQDYKVHLADPDRLVNWDYVQQVVSVISVKVQKKKNHTVLHLLIESTPFLPQRIYSHEVPSCPICLYPPLTARITRCGHIFCWPCMLHYISLSDKSWSKCPICYESVHLADLKR